MKNILIVSLMAILVLAACASSAPATATSAPTTVPPTTVPTSTTIPTSTATPTPTVFAPEIPEFPDPGTGEPAGPEEPAGLYKPPVTFSIPFTLQTHKVYRGIYEWFPEAQIFGVGEGEAYNPPKSLLFWAVKSIYSVEEVISDLRATKSMTSTENQAAMVGGISGTQFDATAEQTLAIPAMGAFVGHSGNDWHTDEANPHLRFIVLSISGRTLLIYIQAPQDEWDSFIEDANQVLDTVKFAATTP